jgi:uncharacterized membrane protein YccC
MTDVASPPVPARGHVWSVPARWVRAKDPDRLALKRSVRAAVVMPAAFGLTYGLFADAQISLFAGFGSFALLLLVDFPGHPRTRLTSYLALFAVGCVLITVGTTASTHKVAAVVAMALVGFAVLYAGIISPQAATASTAALLTFVLPVAVAQPTSEIGPRLFGWVIAAGFCIPACLLIWPTPWHDDLRRRLAATLRALARVADAHAEGSPDDDAQAAMSSELALLRNQFSGTPYPPTSAASGAVALSKLMGRVEWVAGNATLTSDEVRQLGPPVRAVIEAAAETLRRSAALVCDADAHPVQDGALVDAVQDAVHRLDGLIGAELQTDVSRLLDAESPDPAEAVSQEGARDQSGTRGSLGSVLDPGFHVRGLGIATEMVADAALASAGAQTVVDRRLGAGMDSAPHNFGYRLTSHLSFRSVWFRNAVRGAAGLALAVAVVEITDVSHGFWVVLGTLSVLRSNALGTGATALRAVGGTAVGFVVGSVIMIGVADHLTLLWVLLPVAILISGVAPSMISFAAGQAGFTVVVIILFNIIAPTGWMVGLTRIEDVAIGCAVSVVVGFLFWPRGATAALGRALSSSFVTNSGYLADAVDRLTMTTRPVDTSPAERESHSAYLLLDDAFRQYFAERGAKLVSLETVSRLFTGSNRLRLAAYTLSTLPVLSPSPGQREVESVAVAGAVLRDSYASSHRWYEEFAEVLANRRSVLDQPPAHDQVLHDVLREAFEEARAQRRVDGMQVTMQMLWADELLENQDQVQSDLAASADLFVRQRRRAV